MFKVKALFCKFGAINEDTQETTEAVFQHFSEFFGFKNPKNCKLIEAINKYRNEKFGNLPFCLVGDSNDAIRNREEISKHFDGKEVLEVVFDSDGTHFERATWKVFTESRWNAVNMNPIIAKPRVNTWKKPKLTIMDQEQYVAHTTVTEELSKAFNNSSLGKLGSIYPDSDKLFEKIASGR